MLRTLALSFVAAAAIALPAQAGDEVQTYKIAIENHQFVPATLEVPAGKPFKLEVENKDATAEEFESHDFKAEKVIAGKSKAIIKVKALKPGEYNFVGEFHEDTTKGKLIVK